MIEVEVNRSRLCPSASSDSNFLQRCWVGWQMKLSDLSGVAAYSPSFDERRVRFHNNLSLRGRYGYRRSFVLQEPLILYHCIGHIPALWSVSCNSEQWGIDMHWWQGLTGWLCSGSTGDLGRLFFVSAKLTQHVGVDKKKRGWKMLEAVSGSNVPSGSKWFRSTPPEQFSNLIMGFRLWKMSTFLRRVDSADSNNQMAPGQCTKPRKKNRYDWISPK